MAWCVAVLLDELIPPPKIGLSGIEGCNGVTREENGGGLVER